MIKYLKEYVRKSIKEHPNLREEIIELYDLAVCEICDGESEQNEIDLAINAINELIEEGS